MTEDIHGARHALTALNSFRKARKRKSEDTSSTEDIIDLITNLGHFADGLGLDFLDLTRIALEHWRTERNRSWITAPRKV